MKKYLVEKEVKMNKGKILGGLVVCTLVGWKAVLNNNYLFQSIIGRDKINAADVGEMVSKTLFNLTIFGKQIFSYDIGFIKDK